ncbi:MAG: hypothetical protein FJ096_10240 [Deltaproteobacteria bacterium]|nr:hypothetical protein [Deltaproteobacteria bacterium]
MTAPIARKHVAIALVSASVLLLQIAVTRILSVLLWYHWAFFAISLSMLGMGAPGVWLALTPRRPSLDRVLLAAGVLTPLGVAAMIRGQHLFGDAAIVFCLVCLLPALLCLGTAICVLLLEADGPDVARMYGSDLLGACAGALLVVPMMTRLATPELAACAGFLPLVAHELVAEESRRWPARIGAITLGLSVAWGAPYRIEWTKQYRETGDLKPMFVRWTPTARLAIFPKIPWSANGFGWGLGTKAATVAPPEQYWLEQDASAGTPITRFDGDRSKVEHLFFDVTSAVYQLRQPKRVAIVGGGGGRDILTAHLAGAEHVDAIELNEGIVSAMRGKFASFNGGVYDLPGVQAIVGEGRSVLTRSPGNYDVIQISMIDSWAATAAGAYSLSENNLYTLEAYRLYYQRLSPEGIVSTSRWLSLGFGFEVQRLLLLVKTALEAEGVAEPMRHIAVVEAGQVASVLMSKAPFPGETLLRLAATAEQRGFSIDLPAPAQATPRRSVTTLIDRGVAQYESQGFSLAPPTDDRPFYFQMVSPFRSVEPALLKVLGVNVDSVRTLRILMAAMAIATLLLFFVPFLFRRRFERGPHFWSGSGYFLAIGLGFMLLEIAWLQRAVLYLGHPSLAATAALGFMLLGAGSGSLLSRRVTLAAAQRWGFGLALACGLLNLAMGPLMQATLGLGLTPRLLVVGAMLTPAGVAMGFAFPLGMQAFGNENRAWFWALNGSASVLASVASLALAMSFGYLRVGLLGAACYLPAWILLRDRERGRGVGRAVTALAALPLALVSIQHVLSLITAVKARLHYPIDLEWMEGGQLLAAHRLLTGKPLYESCSDGYLPFAYPPLHPALLAIATRLFGFEYSVGRAVSILGFACAAALLAREAYLTARGRSRGSYAALAAVGWLAASYPVAGAWYDLIRVDSTFLAMLVVGMVLALPPHGAAPRGRTSTARNVAAALALTAAVFAKQTAILFLPWVVVFSIWREWRSGVKLALLTALFATAALVALNTASHGMFWILVFDVMGHHPLLPELFRSALLTVLFFAPFGVLLLPLTGWLWLKRALPVRARFWAGTAVTAIVVSLMTASKVGAYINNVMSAVVFVPHATVLLGAAWLDSIPRRKPRRALVASAGTALLGYLCASQLFFMPMMVPPPGEWQSAVALVQYVRSLPGHVLFPAHPFIPLRLGKDGPQVHEQGYVDIIGSGLESIDLTACAANLDADWLIVNDKTDPRFLELLSVAYEPRGELPVGAKMRVGKYTSPTRLFERRRSHPWQTRRKHSRTLFDFESGSLEGWQRTGRAFDEAATVADLPHQQPITGHAGHRLLNTYHPALLDEATGSATSPTFTLDREKLGFRIGGGGSERLRVELVVGGDVVRSTHGVGLGMTEQLVPFEWDVAALRGKEGHLVLRDDERGEWGHLLLDDVALFDSEPR